MSVFERIAIYGSSPCYSRRGKSREVLCNELNSRLHPRKRTRRRVNPRRIHMLPGKSEATQSLGKVGQNVHDQGYGSWDEAIRVARASLERVDKTRRTDESNPVFKVKGSMQTGGSSETASASELR